MSQFFFSTDVVFLLNMVIITCNLYHLGFVWVLEGFRILSFWKFINFFAKTFNSRSSYIFVKRPKTHRTLWRGGIFPTSKKNFWVFNNYIVDLNCAQNGLRGAVIARRNWALAIAEKSGYG